MTVVGRIRIWMRTEWNTRCCNGQSMEYAPEISWVFFFGGCIECREELS